jgi:hypothetical protein
MLLAVVLVAACPVVFAHDQGMSMRTVLATNPSDAAAVTFCPTRTCDKSGTSGIFV